MSILFNEITSDFLDSNDLNTVLDTYYLDIAESMTNNNYIPEFTYMDTFVEILYDNVVVGFISLENIRNITKIVSVNEVYIIPEYRNMNLFKDFLISYIERPNINITIRNPTQHMIDWLIKYGFAYECMDNIIFSNISFTTSSSQLYKNKTLKRLYKKISDDRIIEFPAVLFDVTTKSIYFFDQKHNYVKQDYLGVGLPRKIDMEKYHLRKKLKRITPAYLDKIYSNFIINLEEIEEFDDNKDKENLSRLTIENILGNKNKFSEEFNRKLEKHDFNKTDGINIINKVKTALDKNEITPRSIMVRADYLLEHPEHEAINTDDFEDLGFCPYCNNDVYISDYECRNCGYDFKPYYDSLDYDELI